MWAELKADLRRFRPAGATRTGWRPAVRGFLSQGFQAIAVYRFFHACRNAGIPTQPVRFLVERFVEIVTGIQIPAACRIGPGLRIHHFGGVILHPSTRLGRDCTLYHQVTIGDRGGDGGAAQVGDRVTIGAGAKLIGEIRIGDDVVIGANAVVRQDVPDGHLAVGNPAVVKRRRSTGAPTGPQEVVDGSAS